MWSLIKINYKIYLKTSIFLIKILNEKRVKYLFNKLVNAIWKKLANKV